MLEYTPVFYKSDDANIAVYDIGKGFPLVLLHGNGEDSSYWSAQIPELSKFFRVIAIDSRGHGLSTFGACKLSLALMAEDLKQILDALRIRKAFFLGFSDGGNVLIKFALKYQSYIQKMILNGANVHMFKGLKRHVKFVLYGGYGLTSVVSLFHKEMEKKQEILGLMTHSYGVEMEDLEEITVPVLLIVGEYDMIKRAETEEMHVRIPNSELRIFKDGDHFIAAKQPARFNRTVIEFLIRGKNHGNSASR